ncbi:hypothetical protein R6Z07F_005394 [Ovis aries]
MGGRCSSLPGPAALWLRLALSSPAGDSAPGPQVTPLSQVCFLALFASSGPLRAPRCPPPVPASVGPPAVRRFTGCVCGPSSPLRPAQPRWREAVVATSCVKNQETEDSRGSNVTPGATVLAYGKLPGPHPVPALPLAQTILAWT